MVITAGAVWSLVLVCVAVIMFFLFGVPRYRVWQQEMKGRAELAQAEQNRQIKIENGSLTPTYIQYLWVRQQNTSANKIIYIPTEAGLPILEAKPEQ